MEWHEENSKNIAAIKKSKDEKEGGGRRKSNRRQRANEGTNPEEKENKKSIRENVCESAR